MVHGGIGRTSGLLLPAAGVVVIVAVLWFSVKDSTTWSAPPVLGLFWCAIGLAIAVAASAIAKRVGASLAAEVGIAAPADPAPL